MAAKPQCWRWLWVEHGAKPTLLARARAQVIVQRDAHGHWRVVKNTTGHRILLKP